jgi:hypothetical protein
MLLVRLEMLLPLQQLLQPQPLKKLMLHEFGLRNKLLQLLQLP